MTSQAIASADDLGLAGRIRAAKLPPPEERRAIRERAGVTLREIADEIGVSASAVLRWERGDRAVRRTNAIAYRRVLDALRDAA